MRENIKKLFSFLFFVPLLVFCAPKVDHQARREENARNLDQLVDSLNAELSCALDVWRKFSKAVTAEEAEKVSLMKEASTQLSELRIRIEVMSTPQMEKDNASLVACCRKMLNKLQECEQYKDDPKSAKTKISELFHLIRGQLDLYQNRQ